MIKMRLPAYLFGLAALLAGTLAPRADGLLPRSEGKVILTVAGNIGVTNAPGKAEFDRALLEALGESRLETTTPWTEGRHVFEGVAAKTLLEALDARGTRVKAVALNDYAVVIPITDLLRYPVLLALKMDGKPMRVRNKGPIWIVYPYDRYEELRDPTFNVKWVWQLSGLIVE
jgi:hypothetical protein